MRLFSVPDRPFVEAVAELAYTNPFLPRRTELEHLALGREFDDRFAQWNVERDAAVEQPNLMRLVDRTEAILLGVRERFDGARELPAAERQLHEDLVWFTAYHRLRGPLARIASEGFAGFDVRRRLYDPLRAKVLAYVGDGASGSAVFKQVQIGRASCRERV